jgi:hypothetical protein
MTFFIGFALALAVSMIARLAGFDRERVLYPTLTIVIASYYALFAVMGGSLHSLAIESIGVLVWAVLAGVGFKANLWLVVAALAAHGVFDFFHAHAVANPGVPAWWPSFCLSYDFTAAVFLAWLLRSEKLRAAPLVARDATPEFPSADK